MRDEWAAGHVGRPQGAILLIAAKRQDAAAAALSRHDYATNVISQHDIRSVLEQLLLEINQHQVEMTNGLQSLIERHCQAGMGESSASAER